MGNVPLNQTGLGARALFDGASPSKARAQFTRNSNYGVHRRRLDSSSSVTFLPLSLAPPVSFFDPLYFPSHAPMLIPACVCVGMCCSQASMHSCSRGTKVSRQWLEIQDGIKMVSHLMVHFRILCGWGGAIDPLQPEFANFLCTWSFRKIEIICNSIANTHYIFSQVLYMFLEITLQK